MAPSDLHQHDLRDDAARRIVRDAAVRAEHRVWEIGAGTGALTAALLDTGATVHAIEIDEARVATLQTRFATAIAAGRLTVTCGDARRTDVPCAARWRVIANPPFNLTAALLRRLLLDDLPGGGPTAIDLVMQEQAAKKWTGGHGDETRSSVLARCLGEPRVLARLARDITVPPSHVALAHWRWRAHRDLPDHDRRIALDTLLERAFAGPHTMKDALRGLATPLILKRQAREHGWDPLAHPRTLRPRAWEQLADFLHGIGKV